MVKFRNQQSMVKFSVQPYSAVVPPSKRIRLEQTTETPSSPVAMISGDHSSHDRQFTATFDPDILDCNICMEPLSPPIFQVSPNDVLSDFLLVLGSSKIWSVEMSRLPLTSRFVTYVFKKTR